MSMIKVVSFDADGTLVTPDFSQAVWYDGIPSLYARKYRISFQKAKEFIEKEYQVVGDQRIEWYDITYWLKLFGLDGSHGQILEDYSIGYLTIQMLSRHCRLYIKTTRSLSFLAPQRSFYPICWMA
jgi:putative hydrolase of the HAD superfamily